MWKYIIIAIIIVVMLACIGLHIMIVHELHELEERLSDTYNNFVDEMKLLAETLQVYHELLDNYQIPMIANPTREQIDIYNNNYSGW